MYGGTVFEAPFGGLPAAVPKRDGSDNHFFATQFLPVPYGETGRGLLHPFVKGCASRG